MTSYWHTIDQLVIEFVHWPIFGHLYGVIFYILYNSFFIGLVGHTVILLRIFTEPKLSYAFLAV